MLVRPGTVPVVFLTLATVGWIVFLVGFIKDTTGDNGEIDDARQGTVVFWLVAVSGLPAILTWFYLLAVPRVSVNIAFFILLLALFCISSCGGVLNSEGSRMHTCLSHLDFSSCLATKSSTTSSVTLTDDAVPDDQPTAGPTTGPLTSLSLASFEQAEFSGALLLALFLALEVCRYIRTLIGLINHENYELLSSRPRVRYS
eukprot:m.106965 g.106965  ORF g.106965 m.106965 type:complete len:201 (-) comp51686_c1_seq3:1036-1638(-)